MLECCLQLQIFLYSYGVLLFCNLQVSMNQRIVQVLSHLKQLKENKQKLNQKYLKMGPADQNSSRVLDSVERGRQLTQKRIKYQKYIEQVKSLTHRSLQSIEDRLSLEKFEINEKKVNQLEETVLQFQMENAELRRKVAHFEGRERQLLQRLTAAQTFSSRKLEEANKYYLNKLTQLQTSFKQIKKEFDSMLTNIKQELIRFSLNSTFSTIKERMLAPRGETVSRELQISNLSKNTQNLSTLKEEVERACTLIAENTGIPLPKAPFTKYLPTFTDALLQELSISRFLCESEILVDKQTKMWLVEHLRNEIRFGESVRSKLLYRYWKGELNKVNFHEYIDGKPNILVLARLANCYVVGGFTQCPFKKDHIEKPGNGFLFHATHRSFYPMRNDPQHAVAGYDGYYLIFGNSEFRLKSLDLTLFSNFGNSQGTFQTSGHKRTDFMGTATVDETETDLDSFEIHQIL